MRHCVFYVVLFWYVYLELSIAPFTFIHPLCYIRHINNYAILTTFMRVDDTIFCPSW